MVVSGQWVSELGLVCVCSHSLLLTLPPGFHFLSDRWPYWILMGECALPLCDCFSEMGCTVYVECLSNLGTNLPLCHSSLEGLSSIKLIHCVRLRIPALQYFLFPVLYSSSPGFLFDFLFLGAYHSTESLYMSAFLIFWSFCILLHIIESCHDQYTEILF